MRHCNLLQVSKVDSGAIGRDIKIHSIIKGIMNRCPGSCEIEYYELIVLTID